MNITNNTWKSCSLCLQTSDWYLKYHKSLIFLKNSSIWLILVRNFLIPRKNVSASRKRRFFVKKLSLKGIIWEKKQKSLSGNQSIFVKNKRGHANLSKNS